MSGTWKKRRNPLLAQRKASSKKKAVQKKAWQKIIQSGSPMVKTLPEAVSRLALDASTSVCRPMKRALAKMRLPLVHSQQRLSISARHRDVSVFWSFAGVRIQVRFGRDFCLCFASTSRATCCCAMFVVGMTRLNAARLTPSERLAMVHKRSIPCFAQCPCLGEPGNLLAKLWEQTCFENSVVAQLWMVGLFVRMWGDPNDSVSMELWHSETELLTVEEEVGPNFGSGLKFCNDDGPECIGTCPGSACESSVCRTCCSHRSK